MREKENKDEDDGEDEEIFSNNFWNSNKILFRVSRLLRLLWSTFALKNLRCSQIKIAGTNPIEIFSEQVYATLRYAKMSTNMCGLNECSLNLFLGSGPDRIMTEWIVMP